MKEMGVEMALIMKLYASVIAFFFRNESGFLR